MVSRFQLSSVLYVFWLQQYEEWKNNLPDMDWIKGLIPAIESDKVRKGLRSTAESIRAKANEIDIGEFCDPNDFSVMNRALAERKRY